MGKGLVVGGRRDGDMNNVGFSEKNVARYVVWDCKGNNSKNRKIITSKLLKKQKLTRQEKLKEKQWKIMGGKEKL